MTVNPQKKISVIQGDCFVTDDPFVLYTTVLGSCIAVCMFDEVSRAGGMNHFLLPGDENSSDGNLKYGVHSMELLINGLLKLGAERSNLKAKIFGGSDIRKSARLIGTNNQIFTKSFLDQEGIPCIAENLGGSFARKVQFSPCEGRVRHLLIPTSETPEENLAPPPLPVEDSSIELF